jgi:hypothetical protein
VRWVPNRFFINPVLRRCVNYFSVGHSSRARGNRPDTRHKAPAQVALASHLAAIPDSEPKAEGIRLGEALAAQVLQARANDGSNAHDAYRPKSRTEVAG